MQSELANYYRPLYEMYHIFGLNIGNQTISHNIKELSEKTLLQIQKNLISSEEINLTQANLEELEIINYIPLLDKDGIEFNKQAVEYMKYKNIASLAEKILLTFNLIKDTKKIEPIVKKQIEITEEFSKIDIKVQKLIEYIDGILFSDGCIQKDWLGKIKTKKEFTKMLLTEEVTKGTAKVANNELYSALKKHYINLIPKLNYIASKADSLLKLESEKEEAIVQIQFIENELIQYYSEKNRLEKIIALETAPQITERQNTKEKQSIKQQQNTKERQNIEQQQNTKEQQNTEQEKINQQKSDKNIAELKQVMIKIESLENQITKLEHDNKRLNQQKEEIQRQYQKEVKEIKEIESECFSMNQKALNVLSEINQLRKTTIQEINIYETLLNNISGSVSDELYLGLEEELEWMKHYSKGDSQESIIDFDVLEESLLKQKEYLIEMTELIISESNLTIEKVKELKNKLEKKQTLYKKYTKLMPEFNYSKLNIEISEEKGIYETVKLFLKDGVNGLIFEEYDKLSESYLSGNILPSENYINLEDSKIAGILEIIQNFSVDTLFKEINSENLISALLETAEIFLEKILLLSYLEEHFGYYGSIKEDTVLSYELEYLISGNYVDKENISNVAMRILLLRILANILFTITNQECRTNALTAATTSIGFMGFAGLVSIMKYLILIVWGIEAAIIETTAILQGKQVGFFVKQETLAVNFSELLFITKDTISNKVKKMKDVEGGIRYKDYLYLFLMALPMKKEGIRAMDLIQENIQHKYECDFYIKNCISGFEAEAVSSIPLKFFALPFAEDRKNPEKYLITIKQRVSY